MLKIASGQVIVAGFRRTSERPKDVEGCETIDLGETRDGEFLARIGSVASVALPFSIASRLINLSVYSMPQWW